MSNLREHSLVVPADLVRKSCGLSLDIGASAAKVVYRSKENLEEVQHKPEAKIGHLTLISTSGIDFPLALAHIGQNAVIDREMSSGVVYTTGIGCTLHGKAIGEALHLKLESIPEFDSFVRAFVYLVTNVPRSTLFYDIDESRSIPSHALMDIIKTLVESGQSVVTGADLSYLDNRQVIVEKVDRETSQPVALVEKDMIPCVLIVHGSSNAYLQVNADESYVFLDASTRGGLNFLGMGSLLTGAQTFEELIELAKRGKAHNVDVYTDAFIQEAQASAKEEDSMYTRALVEAEGSGNVLYGFGKCAGKNVGDFNREDVARALLDQFITDYVQTATLVCGTAGIRRCCFSGSFVGNEFIRERFIQELDKRNLHAKIHGKPLTKFDFLKPGSHLGAIGALITHYRQFGPKVNAH